MLYPSIDSLLEQIDSKYTLVTLSSKRAREIQQKSDLLIRRPKSFKAVGKALEEINKGLIGFEY